MKMNSMQLLFRQSWSTFIKHTKNIQKRCINSASIEIQRQSDLFTLEQKRQKELVGRIEKIEVECIGAQESTTLLMNRELSTPFDCAKHLGEKFAQKSAVAFLNGDTLWHMHKPLPDSCKLEFLHYMNPQPAAVNKAFWRTCSFLLGSVAVNAFKDDINVLLHSFPSPNVKSGSFVYDIQLPLEKWVPSETELRVLSIDMIKLSQKSYNIESLDVDADFAQLLFKNNPHKTKQIPNIAAHSNGKITLFRAGTHVDISRGPMVSNTNHLGRVTITNIHKLETDIPGGPIYRFQGVALPSCIVLNHFAYSLLEERARKLNPAKIPGTYNAVTEDNNFVEQMSIQ